MRPNRQEYLQCIHTISLPIQWQPWWLDAVCLHGYWDVALLKRQDQLIAAWPFYIRKRFGLRTIGQPPFTAYTGPWIHSDATPAKTHRIFRSLLSQIPASALHRQSLAPGFPHGPALAWEGFRLSRRYTYQWPVVPPKTMRWGSYKPALRHILNNNAAAGAIRRDDHAFDLLWALHGESWRRRGQKPPYAREAAEPLFRALGTRKQCALWTAGEEAALLLAFDTQKASLLLTGVNAAGRREGALPVLVETALDFAAEKGLGFDFEGSMHPGIEPFFRAFGAPRTAYDHIHKAGNRWLDFGYRLWTGR